MNKLLSLVVAAGLLSPAHALSKPLSIDPQVLRLQDAFAAVAAQVKPAVVSITSVHVETMRAQPQEFYFGDPFQDFFYGPQGRPVPQRPPQRRTEGTGSGVIIDPKGYVLTNEHVVRGASDIQVHVDVNGEETTYKGKVVGKDPNSDLAVVRIEPKTALAYASLGDSTRVRVGDWAIAVGSPFGLGKTVTTGVISALGQLLNVEGTTYNDMIQTDAAINRGNSGGPLVNIQGEVIGINTAIFAPTGVFAGIGFAIPSSRAKEIMTELIDKGRVIRGWLGVEIAPLNDVMARQFGAPDKNGVLINRLEPGAPADKAGVKRGDVLIEFNGERIKDPASLQRAVAKTAPGKKVAVKVIRAGTVRQLMLVTGERPDNLAQGPGPGPSPEETPGETSTLEWEGATFANHPGDEGVVVQQIKPGSAMDEAGLAAGDVIVSLNQSPTPTLREFKNISKRVKVEEGVLFDLTRQGRSFYLSYRKAS